MTVSLRVWRFTDGRPGHEKQTEGLLQGLTESLSPHGGSQAALDVREIKLAEHLPNVSALWSDPNAAPDLLIGAGRRTHWPIARVRWHLGSRAVLLMKPSLPKFCYDLALVPEHDSLWSERKVLRTLGMLGPSIAGDNQSDRGVILLGGESSHYRWQDQEIASALRKIVQQSPGVFWQISDSPRSSQQLLATASATLAGCDNAEVIHYADKPPNWLTRQLAIAGQVWVSADSASMLYEALSSGARVGVIELASKSRRNKLQSGIDALIEQQWLGQIGGGALDAQVLTTEPLQEHRRCAEWILQHWFSDSANS